MTPSAVRHMLKTGAKRRLRSYFLPCVGVSLVGGVITSLLSLILTMRMPDPQTLLQVTDLTPYLPQFAQMYGLSFLFSLLLSPLTIGSYAFFMEVSRDRKPPFTSIFTWLGEFSKIKAAFGANLWFVVIALKYILLYSLLPAALYYSSSYLFDILPLAAATIIYFLTFFIFLAAAVLTYAKISSFTPALYMIAEKPSLGIRSTFRFCGTAMKNHIWEFFWFQLSFLGWQILAAFTYGLSTVFVTPYITLSTAGYTHWLMLTTLEESPVPQTVEPASESESNEGNGDAQ